MVPARRIARRWQPKNYSSQILTVSLWVQILVLCERFVRYSG